MEHEHEEVGVSRPLVAEATTTATPPATIPTKPTTTATTATAAAVSPRASVRGMTTSGSTASLLADHNRVPITLTWRDLTYDVSLPAPSRFARRRQPQAASSAPPPPTSKRILSNVTGYCRPGQLMAIMGSSGAGKTTFLNCLSGRNHDFTGDVLLNGKPLSKQLAKHTAFVQQADLFFHVLTVREHLTFQAKMRMARTTEEQRQARVEQVIHELGLTKVADSRIGNVGLGGISGGERRRLSFATEILNNPSLLFVDEPTSGLDSFMADEVVSILRDLADHGRTIICTIHQPSSEVYMRFDTVCYLASGRVAYAGAVSGALDYFGALGHPCPSYTNPADFIIRLLSIEPAALEASQRKVNDFLDQYATSNAKAAIDADVALALQRSGEAAAVTRAAAAPAAPAAAASSSALAPPSTADDSYDSDYAVGWFVQMQALGWRAMITIVRDATLTKARMGQAIVLGLIVGLIYLRLGDNQESVQNKMGAIFFMLVNQSFGGIFGVLQTFPAELPIFQREFKARMYSSHAYFLSRTVVELPMIMIFPAVFCTIAYWMIGLRDDFVSFIYYVLIVILTANSAMSLGYLISCLAPTVQVALAISTPIILPFMLFGGLFINVNSIPTYFYWLSYVSFFQYGFEILGVIIWRNTTLPCQPGTKDYCTGAEVLARYSMSENNVGRDIGVLFALAIGFRAMAYFFLRRRANSKKF